jgi:hypothetical protein
MEKQGSEVKVPFKENSGNHRFWRHEQSQRMGEKIENEAKLPERPTKEML